MAKQLGKTGFVKAAQGKISYDKTGFVKAAQGKISQGITA